MAVTNAFASFDSGSLRSCSRSSIKKGRPWREVRVLVTHNSRANWSPEPIRRSAPQNFKSQPHLICYIQLGMRIGSEPWLGARVGCNERAKAGAATSSQAYSHPARRWFFLALFTSLTLIFVEFLPSAQLVTWVERPSLVIRLLTGGLTFWLMVMGARQSPATVKGLVGILFSPLFGYVLGKNLVFLGPMLLALFLGQEVEIPFTVSSADGNGSRGCRSPVELEGLPFMFDRVCGVSKELRQRLGAGTSIVVIGRGTRFGVYADRLRITD